MDRKFLEGLGLEKEAIDKIMAEHGNTINTTKQELDSVTTERDKLQGTLEDRNKQLEKLKDVDPDKLKQEIADLQAANETKDTEHAAEIKEIQLNSAIKLALNGQVHNEEMALGQIKTDKLVIGDDGKVIGLDEQVEGLKESMSFLFKSDEVDESGKPKFTTGNHGNSGTSKMTKEEIMKEPNAIKRQKLIREHSKLFR